MARMGLGPNWNCLFANDFDRKKAQSYKDNWGADVLKFADVRHISVSDLPSQADLVWGSFPCQDLSLRGGGAGLKGDRSGTFWPFWDVIKALVKDGRGPRMIVLENVCGTLTSHGGKDFAAICEALSAANYRYGAVVIDAALFVPQSRPRLFIIALKDGLRIPPNLSGTIPSAQWHRRALLTTYEKLSPNLKEDWIWWKLPTPPSATASR